MGCDGGTIPKRDELVRTKKKAEQKDKQSELSFRWGHCSITQEPLQKPIVACQMGRLYNKIAVIEAILDKTKLPNIANHIKSIKDVKELCLTDNSAFTDKAKTNEVYDDSLIAPYVCPITGLEMNGKFRFVYLWSCGCAISERALKVVDKKQCHKCLKPCTDEDVIVLNGTEDDLDLNKSRMISRKLNMKALKKASKQDIPASAKLSEASSSASSSTSKKTENGSTKRSAPIDLSDPQFKKKYSVAKDPKASDVFKSLFTSHSSAAKKDKAHWVTYNPFYN